MKKEKIFIYKIFKMYNNLYNISFKMYFDNLFFYYLYYFYYFLLFIHHLTYFLSPIMYPISGVSNLIFF